MNRIVRLCLQQLRRDSFNKSRLLGDLYVEIDELKAALNGSAEEGRKRGEELALRNEELRLAREAHAAASTQLEEERKARTDVEGRLQQELASLKEARAQLELERKARSDAEIRLQEERTALEAVRAQLEQECMARSDAEGQLRQERDALEAARGRLREGEEAVRQLEGKKKLVEGKQLSLTYVPLPLCSVEGDSFRLVLFQSCGRRRRTSRNRRRPSRLHTSYPSRN